MPTKYISAAAMCVSTVLDVAPPQTAMSPAQDLPQRRVDTCGDIRSLLICLPIIVATRFPLRATKHTPAFGGRLMFSLFEVALSIRSVVPMRYLRAAARNNPRHEFAVSQRAVPSGSVPMKLPRDGIENSSRTGTSTPRPAFPLDRFRGRDR